MRVSVTEIQNFQRCRLLWDFTSFNRQGLTRIVHRPALDIGTLFHQTMAEWVLHPDADPIMFYVEEDYPGEHGETLHGPVPHGFEANAAQLVKQAKESYRAQVGAPISESELLPVWDAIDTARYLVENYRDFWKTPLPEGYRLVQPEQTIVVPIPNTGHACERCYGTGDETPNVCSACDGAGWTQHELEMTLDSVLADEHDQLYVHERKTYDKRPDTYYLNTANQFIAYMWGLRQLNIGRVVGIAYDGVWKREKPPRKKTGGHYDVADLFLRTLIVRSEAAVERFEQELTAVVLDMARANEDASAIYSNRRWEGCFDCGVKSLCDATFEDEDMSYILKHEYTKRPRTSAFA